VHINRNMGAEAAEPLLDIACLLTCKLGVITVGIKVGRQRALEV
jgi:hypothetical protein